MKDYLLFDLDGTLTDPKLGITSCVQYALKSFGIEEPDLDKLEPFIGPPLKDSFMQFYGFDEAKAEAAVAKYRERFQDIGLFENEIYRGIKDMLRTLKKKGMHLAVASSKPTVFVERILEHFKIRKYFDAVVGSELDGRRVNKDEVVQEALSQLFQGDSIDRDRVYMIGDRKFDVEGAKAQGVESIAVSYGYGSMEELKEAGADYIVRTVRELESLLYREFVDRESDGFFQGFLPLIGPVLLLVVVRSLGMAWVPTRFFGYHANRQLLIVTVAFILVGFCIRRTARWYLRRGRESRWLHHLWPEENANYLYLLLGSLGLILGGIALIALIHPVRWLVIFYDMVYARDLLIRSFWSPDHEVSFWVGLLCSVLIIPVVEEVVFRGIFYNGLREKMNLLPAMGCSSILFSLYQMNLVTGVYAFVFGMLLAYTYEYFGDFRLVMVLHVMSAFFMYLLTCRSGFSPLYNWPVCVICLLVAVIFIGILMKKKKIY